MASVVSRQARPQAPSASAVRQLLQRNSYAAVPLALFVVLFIVNAAIQPQFLSQQSWAGSMAVLCPTVLTAMAVTLPVLSGNGGIDLSVGPMAGFITVLIAAVLVPAGITSQLIIPVVIVFGALSGAVNGLLIAYVRLPAIIATLGMYLFYDGLGTEVLPQAGGNVPVWLVKLNGSYGPVPAVWVVFAVIAVVWVIMTRGSYPRNLLAVGGDERAAFTAGVNVARLRLITYSIGGVLASLAGLMLTGLIQSGDGTVGAPYTISALTAVALGGISLSGGRGGLLGGALGGAVLFLIQELLTDAHVSVYQTSIIDGVILIFALALNGTVEHLRRRSFAARRG
ncbi:MAG TPA: ABC transporter permease [Trebonia sp.]|nr:ABC transporter permease [Trebonia sp.]